MLTPEIGIRCAFTPVVNHFYREFLYPQDQEEIRPGDIIVQVGDHHVEDWSQLSRQLVDAQRAPAEAGEEADLKKANRRYLLLDGRKLGRIDYLRCQPAVRHSAWFARGPPAIEPLVPSGLWFFLTIG